MAERPKSNRKRTMAAVLAGAGMFGFLVLLFCLLFANIPEKNLDLLKTGMIALIGFVTTSYGYYQGSSDSSARKDEERATEVSVAPEIKDGDA